MRFRAQWYAEQRQAVEAFRVSKKPVGRKRRAPNAPASWNGLRSLSTKLTRQLEDLLRLVHEPAPGESMPEVTVSLIADHATDLSPTIEPPARSKPVDAMGRYRVAVGGKVEANTVIARLEISAKVTVWGAPGAGAQSEEMTRSTWILPLESAGKQEKRYKKQQGGK